MKLKVSAENCLQYVNIANKLTQSNSVSAEVYHNLIEIADNVTTLLALICFYGFSFFQTFFHFLFTMFTAIKQLLRNMDALGKWRFLPCVLEYPNPWITQQTYAMLKQLIH